MSKKTMKILTFIVSVLLLISMSAPMVFAEGTQLTPDSIQPDYSMGTTDIQNFGGKIIGVVQTAGVVIAVVVLMILGIKYMMGSAEEKAEYKKTMIPYLVGAILIFAATTIANIVYQFATSLNSSTTSAIYEIASILKYIA